MTDNPRFFLTLLAVILLTSAFCTAAETYVPGQILVKYDPSRIAGNESVTSFAASANNAIGSETILDYGTYGLSDLFLVALNQNMTVPEAVSYYSALPGVAYAEPDYLVHADTVPNDPELWRQWGLSNTGQVYRENGTPGRAGADIHAGPAWDRLTGNHSATVAVLDSGVDIDHPDLKGNLWTDPQTGMHGLNLIRGEAYDVRDDFGHGTHCAGIIGMTGNNSLGGSGVNWNISIASLKAIRGDNTGQTSDFLLAILYASMKKFPVMSCSFGVEYSNAMYEAIKNSPALIVASAGNEHMDAELFPQYPACYDLPNVIGVAATDANDTLTRFSNYGNRTIQVAAPGQDIYSTFLSIYSYSPVWYAESGNLTPWNITGNMTIDTRTGYPAPPSIALEQSVNKFGEFTLETIKPVNFSPLSKDDELYVHYRIEANSVAGAEIRVFESTDRQDWQRIGTILCEGNNGWNQGYLNLKDDMASVYYRLEIVPYAEYATAFMKIGSVGIGKRGSLIQPGYAYMNGTSMAAPFVSGAAILIHEADPSLSAAGIKQVLMETVDPLPSLTGKIATGGRINLTAALDRVLNGAGIQVRKGWNFISIPKQPAPGFDTARIFAGIDSAGHSVLTYHNETTGWKTVSADDPVRCLEGYWIYAVNRTVIPMQYLPPSNISSRNVSSGWNAVGGWTDREIPANITFSSLDPDWSYLYGYDGEQQQYQEVIIRGGSGPNSDTRPVRPGQGYWLYMAANGTYRAKGAD